MKAIVYDRYGPPEVLQVRDVPCPVPGPNEVLVRVHASSATTSDWRFRSAIYPGVFWLPGRIGSGLFRPRRKILGAEFSGEVAKVGAGVTRFQPGDAVFGYSGLGSNAEYLVMAQDGVIVAKPGNLTHAQAAAIPNGALTARYFLRGQGGLRTGQNVLIVGAAGGIGAYAVQIAKHLGAHVTAVCSAGKATLVAELGADTVIDYATQDFRDTGQTYDIIFDTAGATRFSDCKRSLAPDGRHLFLLFGLRELFQMFANPLRGQKVKCSVTVETRQDMELIAELAAHGAIKPVIGRIFPMDQVVAAHAYVESGHKTGSAILTVIEGPAA